ncbi:MAG: YceI family protein [Planctomycetota bacterium]|jgi:polyisoprenoid-binding protein YceI
MFIRVLSLVAMLAWMVAPCSAEALKLNKEKSKVEFVGKKTDGSHKGGFKEFTVDAKADTDSPDKSTINIEIDTESLWSDDAKLTEHLKNPDFFNVRKYPKIKFESTKIEVDGESATITGKLTMLDQTSEIKVPVKVNMSETSIALIADFKLDRTKFGMGYGKGKIDDQVEISAELKFDR